MRAVLLSASAGRTARETAVELVVSESTVRAELAAAYVRLGARNAPHAIAIALRAGELNG
jgi:DNA-binding CsgD family transcriptional regulator